MVRLSPITDRLGTVWNKIEAMRALLYTSTRLYDEGRRDLLLGDARGLVRPGGAHERRDRRDVGVGELALPSRHLAVVGRPIDHQRAGPAVDDRGDHVLRIGGDDVSAVQLAQGSSGVPETFVIDSHGVIRDQHIGGILPEEVPEMLARLKAAQ